jgi:hypothetical protein
VDKGESFISRRMDRIGIGAARQESKEGSEVAGKPTGAITDFDSTSSGHSEALSMDATWNDALRAEGH